MSENDPRRGLPAVDRLLSDPRLQAAAAPWSRRTVLAVLRQTLDRARLELARGGEPRALSVLVEDAVLRLNGLSHTRPRRVINATGVVIHTNLGRAPLTRAVLSAMEEAAVGYSDLEFDLEAGQRGSRQAHVAELLSLLFPGSGALVVNNNAAALLLALNTLALGKEVIVSRGELVEIGGSFRIPEVVERAGVGLVEVGTTNRTHLRDYEAAINDRTALILKVWPSNYRVIGFTTGVTVSELADLGAQAGVPVIADQGCGRLFSAGPGPKGEIAVEQLLEEKADLVTFSGDKLIGGPQAGLIIGQPGLIQRCAKNPLARALRPGKLTLAGLGVTLAGWMAADPAQALPAVGMLEATRETLGPAAERLAAAIRAALPTVKLEIREGVSRVGGGAAPEEDLPTVLVALRPAGGGSEQILVDQLRKAEPPVVARVEEGWVLFDPRTLLPGEAQMVAAALQRVLAPA